MKNPLTPAGIEPATFRFVAQHLNHCATTVSSCVRTLHKGMGGGRYSFTHGRNTPRKERSRYLLNRRFGGLLGPYGRLGGGGTPLNGNGILGCPS